MNMMKSYHQLELSHFLFYLLKEVKEVWCYSCLSMTAF
jgi:hypothetical protein